jgi:hypothetical protein
MKFCYKSCLSLGLLAGLFLQPVNVNASWDPYENLRIALGNWTPTPIFKIENSSEFDENYKFIKGNATEVFFELEQKKAELLMLVSQIQQIKDCKLQTCYTITEDANGEILQKQISIQEIDKSLEKLTTEFNSLDKFIGYAEKKLINELPKIKLALDVEILGGKTELRELRDNIKNMIRGGEVVPIGKATEYIEIKPSETWGIDSFQFSGTVLEVTKRLMEAKVEVSKRYEQLTGIKAVFSEYGNNIAWDTSNASRPNGISEDSTPEEYQSYVALKELSIVNYVANQKIIEGALFKSIDQRTDLEKNVMQARITETKEILKDLIKQRELGILMAKAEFEKSQPVLVEKKTELVEVLERLRTDPATSNEKIAEYENLIKNTEYQIISLQNRIEAKNTSSDGGATWYDGASESINNYLEELQKLTPESATVEVKTLIDQVSKSIDKEYSQYSHINRLNELNTGLFNAQEYFRTATEQAKEWQASAVNAAKENIQSIQNYWAAQKDATQENITSITNQYIAQGTDPVLARQWAESKFDGALPQLIAQEKAALEGALQWYESVNQESLSDIAISKFGLDQVQDKIEFIEKELNSLTKPGTE